MGTSTENRRWRPLTDGKPPRWRDGVVRSCAAGLVLLPALGTIFLIASTVVAVGASWATVAIRACAVVWVAMLVAAVAVTTRWPAANAHR